MARAGSISEDWEDVDDNLSVISLDSAPDSPVLTGSGSKHALPAQATEPTRTDTTLPIRHAQRPESDNEREQDNQHSVESQLALLSLQGCRSNCVVGAGTSTITHSARTEQHTETYDEPEREEQGEDGPVSPQDTATHTWDESSSQVAEQGPVRGSPEDQIENPFRDPVRDPFLYADDTIADSEFAKNTNATQVRAPTIHNAFPLDLQRELRELRNSLDQTAQTLTDIATIDLTTSSSSLSMCSKISRQVAELTPIIDSYVKVWSVTQDVPLDSNLRGWLRDVVVEVRFLQDGAREIRRQGDGAAWGKGAVIVACAELNKLESQMKDFLPIIRMDFSEFHTRHMHLPVDSGEPRPVSRTLSRQPAIASSSTAVASSSTAIAARSTPIDIPSTQQPKVTPWIQDQTWQLRRALYSLKDAMQQAIDRLCATTNHPDCPASLGLLASDVAKTYKTLSLGLATILSNNGSDWIESGLSGGTTYAEFMTIDRVLIQEFTAQLQDIMDDDGPPPESEYDREPQNKAQPLESEQIEQLECVVQVLESTIPRGQWECFNT